MHVLSKQYTTMALPNLHWSSLLELWNGRHVRTGCTFVPIASCAIDLARSCCWCSMQYVWGHNLTLIIHVLSKQLIYHDDDADYVMILLHSLNVLNGCHVGHGCTESTFSAIATCAVDIGRSYYWRSMRYGAAFNITSCAMLFLEYTATLIMAFLVLICGGWMYGTGVMIALDKQAVRL